MLKLKVLVDNYAYIDNYYLAEPALSYYIECDNKRILFDAGYSDAYIINAKKMGINLNNLDYVVLSHSHNDHTGGLTYLVKQYDLSNTVLVTHPKTLSKKYKDAIYIGAPMFVNDLKPYFKEVITTDKPYDLTDNLKYLGQIERNNDYENKNPVGYELKDGVKIDDYNIDDSCLAYKNDKGIFVISACSHSGVCNMVEYSKKIFNNNVVKLVIGGFHLFDDNEVLDKTINYLGSCNIDDLYPCHCVSLVCKHKMMEKLNVHEVGVGLQVIVD